MRLGSIIADAQENRLASHNAVRELRRNKKQTETKIEQRHKRKLKVGVDIPTPEQVTPSSSMLPLARAPCWWSPPSPGCAHLSSRPALGGCRSQEGRATRHAESRNR